MPTYEYRCKECGHEFEIQQSFSDDALTECPTCHGALRKVFGNVGIAFKGSGFYKTDSRGGSSTSATSTKESSGTSSEAKPKETKKTADSTSSTTSTSTSSTSAV